MNISDKETCEFILEGNLLAEKEFQAKIHVVLISCSPGPFIHRLSGTDSAIFELEKYIIYERQFDSLSKINSQLWEFKEKGANSIDPDEVAQYEPPHLDLYCLQIQLFIQSNFNGSNTFGTIKISSRQG